MTPQQAFRKYRGLFKTRRLSLRTVCVVDPWLGMYFAGPRSDTILINVYHASTPELVVGTVLHELIHAEQWAMDTEPDHGRYFMARRKELQAITGLTIHI